MHRSKVLGRCSELTKGQAQAAMAIILAPINAGLLEAPRLIYTFEQYVENVFLPHAAKGWKDSTRSRTPHLIRKHLVGAFGPRLLASTTRVELQQFLDQKSLVYSASTVKHLRWELNDIFKLAAADGLMQSNPAAELRVDEDACQPGKETRPLTIEQAQKYLEALDLRERLAARLALVEGMRPGELLALRWSRIDADIADVSKRIYAGRFGPPKNRKKRDCAISEGTLELLKEWRRLCGNVQPEDLIFASENPEKPITRDNLWRRNMLPALLKVDLAWATFRNLRTTNGTLMKKQGVDPKVGADQRGHGVGVSLAVYTQSDHDQKRQAVRALDQALTSGRKRPKRKTA